MGIYMIELSIVGITYILTFAIGYSIRALISYNRRIKYRLRA
jgi:hypothetical protein